FCTSRQLTETGMRHKAPRQPRRRCGAVAWKDASTTPVAEGMAQPVSWRVWAPRARQVDLVLIGSEGHCVRPMEADGQGHFQHVEPATPQGQRYAFRLDGGPLRPDPCSLWQPDGVHEPSAVFFPEHFEWSDHGWQGVRQEDLVIYELHVGTFTPEG